MNLHTNPSIEELRELMNQIPDAPQHNLVVDYDGEVIVDPNVPKRLINKFKVRMHIAFPITDRASYSADWMRKLLDELIYLWENNVTGSLRLGN